MVKKRTLSRDDCILSWDGCINRVLDWVVTQLATLRHMSRLLRLLPSGPGRVHRLSLRRDQKGHHNEPYNLGRRRALSPIVEQDARLCSTILLSQYVQQPVNNITTISHFLRVKVFHLLPVIPT